MKICGNNFGTTDSRNAKLSVIWSVITDIPFFNSWKTNLGSNFKIYGVFIHLNLHCHYHLSLRNDHSRLFRNLMVHFVPFTYAPLQALCCGCLPLPFFPIRFNPWISFLLFKKHCICHLLFIFKIFLFPSNLLKPSSEILPTALMLHQK